MEELGEKIPNEKIPNEKISNEYELEPELMEKIRLIRKKKGRKSKVEKELLDRLGELENKKKMDEIKLFPTLAEKIFDIVMIDSEEYFYDRELNLLLDINSIPIGFKNKLENNYIFYDSNDDIKKILDQPI